MDKMSYQREYIAEFEASCKEKILYFFGAGESLKKRLSWLKKYKPKGIFDNDVEKSGKSLEGIPITHWNECIVKKLPPESTVFLVSSIMYSSEIYHQLKQAGFNRVFFTAFMESVSVFPGPSVEDLEASKKVFDMLEDETSKLILDRLIRGRMERSWNYKDICCANQYFVREHWWDLTKEEVFVDVGAYNGDTLRRFRKATQNYFERIYAFEPGNKNYETLRRLASNDSRIECYPYALWNERRWMHFAEDDTMNSCCGTEREGRDVEAYPLDAIVKDRITFIKMDIEGAEVPALQGSVQLIRKYQPKLAICIYHRPADLWEIPLYVKQILPEYRLYIRHHSVCGYETVLYAVV